MLLLNVTNVSPVQPINATTNKNNNKQRLLLRAASRRVTLEPSWRMAVARRWNAAGLGLRGLSRFEFHDTRQRVTDF